MAYVLTTNWGDIQTRTIDPYDDVNSDVVNRIFQSFGSGSTFIDGFGIIKYYTDPLESRIAVKIEKGTAIVDNMLIRFTTDMIIPLFTTPTALQENYYIVVEYDYSKTQPGPQAIVKSIKSVQYDATKHLILHNFLIPVYASIPVIATWNTWLTDPNHYRDCRYDTGYIKRSGDIVSGCLILKGTPTLDSHAVSKKWVEDFVGAGAGTFNPSNYIKKSGDTMGGPLFKGDSNAPTSLEEYVTKRYVDYNALKLSGGTMTGSLLLSANNSNSGQNAAVTRKFVDDTFLKLSGGTLTGMLILEADPITPMGAATKQYVDAHGGGGGVPVNAVAKTGDTMTGFLTLHANPTSPLHAATKGYVDSQVSSATGGSSAADCIKRAGDTMTGPLGLFGDPGTDNEAARKKYVDDQITNRCITASSSITFPIKLKRDADTFILLDQTLTPDINITSLTGCGRFSITDKTDSTDNFRIAVNPTNESDIFSRGRLSLESSTGNVSITSSQSALVNAKCLNVSTIAGSTEPVMILSNLNNTPELRMVSNNDSGRISFVKSGSTTVNAEIVREAGNLILNSSDAINIGTVGKIALSCSDIKANTTLFDFENSTGSCRISSTNSTTHVSNGNIDINPIGVSINSKKISLKGTEDSEFLSAKNITVKSDKALHLSGESFQATATNDRFFFNDLAFIRSVSGTNKNCTIAGASTITILGSNVVSNASTVSRIILADSIGYPIGGIGLKNNTKKTFDIYSENKNFSFNDNHQFKTSDFTNFATDAYTNDDSWNVLMFNSSLASTSFVATGIECDNYGYAEHFDLDSSLIPLTTANSRNKVYEWNPTNRTVVLAQRNDTAGSIKISPIIGVSAGKDGTAFSVYGSTSRTNSINLVIAGSCWISCQSTELTPYADLAAARAAKVGKMAIVSATEAGTVEAIAIEPCVDPQIRSKVGIILDVDFTNKRYRVKLSTF